MTYPVGKNILHNFDRWSPVNYDGTTYTVVAFNNLIPTNNAPWDYNLVSGGGSATEGILYRVAPNAGDTLQLQVSSPGYLGLPNTQVSVYLTSTLNLDGSLTLPGSPDYTQVLHPNVPYFYTSRVLTSTDRPYIVIGLNS
jgi:hypothetical protein